MYTYICRRWRAVSSAGFQEYLFRRRRHGEAMIVHVRVSLSFRQPAFQHFTSIMAFSAAWSAFHLKHMIIKFVSSEHLRCRLLK